MPPNFYTAWEYTPFELSVQVKNELIVYKRHLPIRDKCEGKTCIIPVSESAQRFRRSWDLITLGTDAPKITLKKATEQGDHPGVQSSKKMRATEVDELDLQLFVLVSQKLAQARHRYWGKWISCAEFRSWLQAKTIVCSSLFTSDVSLPLCSYTHWYDILWWVLFDTDWGELCFPKMQSLDQLNMYAANINFGWNIQFWDMSSQIPTHMHTYTSINPLAINSTNIKEQ